MTWLAGSTSPAGTREYHLLVVGVRSSMAPSAWPDALAALRPLVE